MKVTEEYLSQISKDSRNLSPFVSPTVRRSRVYDMKDPEQRIEFAFLAARIGIELLYVYPIHRGNGTGLIRRLRGVKPSKLPAEEGNSTI